MTAAAILAELRGGGISPALRGDGIVVPAGRLTDVQRKAIRQHKPELLALLRAEAANDPAREVSQPSQRVNVPHAYAHAGAFADAAGPELDALQMGEGQGASDPAGDLDGASQSFRRIPEHSDDPAATALSERRAPPAVALYLDGDGGVSDQGEHADDRPKLTGRAAERHAARLHRFIAAGLAAARAQAAADLLVIRDEDGDDRRLCLECSLYGSRGHCMAARLGRVIGVSRDLMPVPHVLMRCEAFMVHKDFDQRLLPTQGSVAVDE